MLKKLDSLSLAQEIERRCQGREIPVLIEVNFGREPQKSEVLPEDVSDFPRKVAKFAYIKMLMAMASELGDPKAVRPYFRLTKGLFEKLGSFRLSNVEMRHLSMGMLNTHRVAIEEGANIVRIGAAIFGGRDDHKT